MRLFASRPLCVALCLSAAAAATAVAQPAAATERRFTYTYQSATLNAGQRELEPWTTFRMGRDNFYNRVDNRVEVEFGVTDRLQTSWYLNLSGVTERSPNPNALGNYTRQSSVEHGGVSWELKYKLLDPVADPLGMAVYFEATAGPAEAELEGKLIFDKQIGKLLLALNLFGEQEWEFDPSTEQELSLEATGGIAYFLTPAFTLGLEFWNHNIIGHGDKDWESSALFAGPAVSYAWQTWWATLTVMPQLHNLKGTGPLELEDHEKVNARLIFGTHL